MWFTVYLILLLLYITNCYAKININITVASSKGGIKLTSNGSDDKMISDKEIDIFNITEVNLKSGIRVEFGATPNDVYLKDPTPYGNLYHKFKWQQVNRRVIVRSVAVHDIINENVPLIVHDHINNTTDKLKIPVKLFVNVENSLKSFWSPNGLPDDEIYYETNVTFFNVKQHTFKNKWRNDSIKMVTLPFGYQTAGRINIAPGKTVTMKLRAKKTILLFKITYVAYLTGSFVANYAHLLGTYHFWSPAVANIMKAAKLNNKIITTEIMELKCYTDPVLDVFDKTSGQRIPIVFSSKPFRKRKSK